MQTEAGNRAQSDIYCEVTLALMGGSHGETEPKKATHGRAEPQHKARLYWSMIPAACPFNSGKSPGYSVVELATPNGTNNLTEGTNKNELKVKEGSPSK